MEKKEANAHRNHERVRSLTDRHFRPAPAVDWLTREQAAARLGVCERTITNYVTEMAKAGAGGYVRRGRNFMRVNFPQMMRFLEEVSQ